MAEEHGALLLAVEHRFYGDSINPDGLKTENLADLSSQQALVLAPYHFICVCVLIWVFCPVFLLARSPSLHMYVHMSLFRSFMFVLFSLSSLSIYVCVCVWGECVFYVWFTSTSPPDVIGRNDKMGTTIKHLHQAFPNILVHYAPIQSDSSIPLTLDQYIW